MSYFFFFNDTATTEIYTLSLHDALPIYVEMALDVLHHDDCVVDHESDRQHDREQRSEEHTSELQSQSNLVCRLLLEKKKTITPRRSRSRPVASRIARRLPYNTPRLCRRI